MSDQKTEIDFATKEIQRAIRTLAVELFRIARGGGDVTKLNAALAEYARANERYCEAYQGRAFCAPKHILCGAFDDIWNQLGWRADVHRPDIEALEMMFSGLLAYNAARLGYCPIQEHKGKDQFFTGFNALTQYRADARREFDTQDGTERKPPKKPAGKKTSLASCP
jgi:hypothetical protein